MEQSKLSLSKLMANLNLKVRIILIIKHISQNINIKPFAGSQDNQRLYMLHPAQFREYLSCVVM